MGFSTSASAALPSSVLVSFFSALASVKNIATGKNLQKRSKIDFIL